MSNTLIIYNENGNVSPPKYYLIPNEIYLKYKSNLDYCFGNTLSLEYFDALEWLDFTLTSPKHIKDMIKITKIRNPKFNSDECGILYQYLIDPKSTITNVSNVIIT